MEVADIATDWFAYHGLVTATDTLAAGAGSGGGGDGSGCGRGLAGLDTRPSPSTGLAP